MTRKIFIPVVCLALLVLSGCMAKMVGWGNSFTPEQADAVKVGMTKEEVIKVMGSKPYADEVTTANGVEQRELGWVDLGTFNYRSIGVILIDGKATKIKRDRGPARH